ncbi:MAG: methylmalonyl Co-A mutase-associated GTPase MeaB [Syntrophales bacterium]|nr:methylmalonyl Co-A mutase-associated GTPase MeaB [Syntrophales bacterium]
MEKVGKIRAGDVRTASRLIRNLEDGLGEARTTMKHLFPLTGNAHVIGLTGSPGAGKSTLLDGLVTSFRKEEKTIGVLAVDPTSPFTGGAILGDRIRMQRHAEDPGVFVRSLATRGALGGLAKAVGDAIHILDAMGKDKILVETVGTGQQEVDIINHSHTVLVVLIPGMGDEIQAIKAGIMEIADIFVINKADREGSSKLRRELMMLLDMAPPKTFAAGWRPPIVSVENAFEPESFDKCIGELAMTIEDHYRHLVNHDLLGSRIRRKAVIELNEAIRTCVLDPVLSRLAENGGMEEMIVKLLKKESDPYTLAEGIAKKYLSEVASHGG